MAEAGERDRDHDLVLVGATGFTGGLTADYLAEHAPDGLRWALAGRNATKLEAVRDRLAAAHPDKPALAELPLLHADVTDPASLADVATNTRVVVTTVGPYLAHGEPLVAACAGAGTDYLDLTGEPEFVDRMWLQHHATAERTGARLVHCCGFDSIPHDLGVLFTVQQLPDDVPIRVRGVVRAGGTASSGTIHSALTQMSRVRQASRAAGERRRRENRPSGRSARAVGGRPHRDGLLGLWLLPLPTIDPQVVARSARALPAYGPDFRYSHFAGTRTLRWAAGGAAGVLGLGLASQVGPLRSLLERRFESGDGPDVGRRERSWFTVDLVAETGGPDGAGGGSEERTVRTRVSGGDPGYGETAKMLGEAAMCLALDDNPDRSGQLTPAVAMGDRLLGRLQQAGIRFEVVGEPA